MGIFIAIVSLLGCWALMTELEQKDVDSTKAKVRFTLLLFVLLLLLIASASEILLDRQ